MRCLVCSRIGHSRGRQCKLCGMRSRRPVRFRGFYFCCDACTLNFNNILSRTPTGETREILEREVLI
jgi:hypothetical protein